EFEAAGTPFERRGARADEFLRALIELWTKDPIGFEGEFYRVPRSMVGPKPVQKPYPPIYVAGFGPYAFERAVKYGSGWNPSGVPDFEWLEGMIKQFYETARRAGCGDMEVVLRVFTVVLDEAKGAGRSPMMGAIGEVKEDIVRLRDMGVTHLIHSPPALGFIPTSTVDEGLRLMERLIEISR
ncbi:MAG TPA: LLM class flavin-dependent oxidoreductase, partial [Blastocatellia bacterium]